MIVLIAIPTALLCLLIAWMCLRRGYRQHAVVMVFLSAAVVAFTVAIVAACWFWWQKIALHFV